jgi:hypothetical protein
MPTSMEKLPCKQVLLQMLLPLKAQVRNPCKLNPDCWIKLEKKRKWIQQSCKELGFENEDGLNKHPKS